MSYHPPIVESLAEELVAIRAKQADMKRREAELSDALLSLVDQRDKTVQIPTATAIVRIEQKVTTRFDAKRLPKHICDDLRYRTKSETTYVRVLSPAPRASVRRSADIAEADDADLIERF
ncbi:hypothetical protein [Tateyamaria omphalii]|nr:hypothetical protein [Tateyamaria omphalii]